MPLRGNKVIGVGDKKRYVIDYENWLDTGETVSSITFTVDTGPATVTAHTIAGDGLSVAFFITGASLSYTPFSLHFEAITSAGQEKNDHVDFYVVAP